MSHLLVILLPIPPAEPGEGKHRNDDDPEDFWQFRGPVWVAGAPAPTFMASFFSIFTRDISEELWLDPTLLSTEALLHRVKNSASSF